MFKDVNACFACGRLNQHGLQLDIRRTAAGVEVDYAFPEHFQGWQHIVHGGLVSTVLDELMVWACTAAGRTTVTAELTVRLRRPLRVGQPFHGEGRVVADRGRLLLCSGRLLDSESRVIAEATGKMMLVQD